MVSPKQNKIVQLQFVARKRRLFSLSSDSGKQVAKSPEKSIAPTSVIDRSEVIEDTDLQPFAEIPRQNFLDKAIANCRKMNSKRNSAVPKIQNRPQQQQQQIPFLKSCDPKTKKIITRKV